MSWYLSEQENISITYDTTAYTVTVRVVNDGNGGLAAEIWAIRDGSQNKTDRIVFENKWQAPAEETVTDPEKPTKTEKPESEEVNSESKATVKTAKTGDTAALAIPFAAALAAGALIIVTWRVRKRNLSGE